METQEGGKEKPGEKKEQKKKQQEEPIVIYVQDLIKVVWESFQISGACPVIITLRIDKEAGYKLLNAYIEQSDTNEFNGLGDEEEGEGPGVFPKGKIMPPNSLKQKMSYVG